MACDEVLFSESLSTSTSRAVLRFYSFEQSAITVGVCQKVVDDPEVCGSMSMHKDVTRRITGGGIVVHDNDLPYTFIFPASFAPGLGDVSSSYCVIHNVLRKTLASFGVTAELSDASASVFMGKHNCFVRPVENDLMVNDVKVAGAAQKRKRGWVLHQGSISFGTCFPELSRDLFVTRFTERLASRCDAQLSAMPISAGEKDDAVVLAREKYGTDEWCMRR